MLRYLNVFREVRAHLSRVQRSRYRGGEEVWFLLIVDLGTK
jgi:hypothetical protein